MLAVADTAPSGNVALGPSPLGAPGDALAETDPTCQSPARERRMSAKTTKTDLLDSENGVLRVRVEELERKLYRRPFVPQPKERPGRHRYLRAARHDGGDDSRQRAWARVQELAVGWAFEYARGRHSDVNWRRAYEWQDSPPSGVYTVARLVLDAKHAEADLPFFEIDKRTAALDAVRAQRQRVRDREGELLETLPEAGDRDAHRVWAVRHQVLSEAARWNSPLERAFQVACTPLVDYDDVVLAATRLADRALERERQVTLEDIPGYRPDGSWTCDKCGYPFEDSATCFTCDACGEADPSLRASRQRLTELAASDAKRGGRDAANRLIESRHRKLESLRWAVAGQTATNVR